MKEGETMLKIILFSPAWFLTLGALTAWIISSPWWKWYLGIALLSWPINWFVYKSLTQYL